MKEHLEWTLAPHTDEWFDWQDVVVFDCEANGLLDKPDYRLHCAWAYDMRTREYHSWRPNQLADMFDFLNGRVIVAHNGLGYDYLALRLVAHVYGKTYMPKLEVDTLVLVRMLWALDNLIEPDAKLWRAGKMPGNKMKTQGLEAWGYRLGEMKGDYSAQCKAQGIDPWAEFNEDMFSYNKQDVTVNLMLLLLIFRKLGWFQEPPAEGEPKPFKCTAQAVELEHIMQTICLHQERRGLGFNQPAAIKLSETLSNMMAERTEVISSIFKPWWQPSGDTKRGTIAPRTIRRRMTELPKITIRRFSEKTGKELAPEFNHPWCTTEEGASYVPVKYTEFNLGNRHHLANRLIAVFGWKPSAYGGAKGTDPVIDEATISAIPDEVLPPELKRLILDYYVISKTHSTLTSGNSAWLRLYDEDTKTIHGRCNPLGTITHRGAHDKPNLGNIPSVELDEEKVDGKVVSSSVILGVEGGFGHECRELFGAQEPFDTETGTDVYALEVFMMAHYLFPFDDGVLAAKLADPDYDIHQDNANICALPRKDVKTTFYKTIYGSGALDIGRDVWKDDDDVADWCDAPGVKPWINWNQQRLGDAFQMPTKKDRAFYGKGKLYQNKLLNGVPGLKDLKQDVTAAGKRGYIKAIDGRRLSIRKEFATLNALLQGSGSIVCKRWIANTHTLLEAKGLKQSTIHPGTGRIIEAHDYNQIAWVHDETQWEHHKSLGDEIGTTAEAAIKLVTEQYGLRVTLRTAFKVGDNWAACH